MPSREEAKTLFQSLGATVQNSVTSSTDILLVGSEPGENKYNGALKSNVPIIPWEMFLALGLLPKPDVESRLIFSPEVSTLVLLMAPIVDNIYAHTLTRRSPRLLTAFKLGAESISRLLLAAWGTSDEINHLGRDWGLAHPDDVTRKLVRDAVTAWVGLLKICQEEV